MNKFIQWLIPGWGLSKEVIIIDGIEMTQEELTSAFEEFKTCVENELIDGAPEDQDYT